MQLYRARLLNNFSHRVVTGKGHILLAISVIFSSLASHSAWADLHPRNASLNYSQKSLSSTGNPAAGALTIERKDAHVMTGGSISVGGGAEYGDMDELFAKIDELSLLFNPPEEEGGPPAEEQPPELDNGDRNYIWEDLFYAYPELEDRLELVKAKVVTTVAVLALISSEGYGKAEASGELNLVINDDLWGGTLLFDSSIKGSSKALGLFDEINFDSSVAREELRTIRDLDDTDPIQELDLSGGITLYYDPANGNVKMSVDNDSLLLIKAAKESKFSFTYSKKAFENNQGSLYWGVKPTLYRIGLTNASTRIGEVTDVEALFNDIKDAQFVYSNGYDVDIGIVWAAQNYQFGASVKSLFEHEYKFPELDKTEVDSVKILNQLNQHESYVMARQLKFELGLYSDQREWSLNAELDANAIEDPMKDKYKWFTLTGGYATNSWWLPSARIGVSRNLTGSKLSYLNAGVTMMKFLNLDVSTTLDTVTLDGSEQRRGFSVNLGVQFEY